MEGTFESGPTVVALNFNKPARRFGMKDVIFRSCLCISVKNQDCGLATQIEVQNRRMEAETLRIADRIPKYLGEELRDSANCSSDFKGAGGHKTQGGYCDSSPDSRILLTFGTRGTYPEKCDLISVCPKTSVVENGSQSISVKVFRKNSFSRSNMLPENLYNSQISKSRGPTDSRESTVHLQEKRTA
ncbi:hypothetical protein JTB14_012830 [Gonioctena quinquepunctata]|nr:hypothetical protein JTB14_012830 [Gonioctena quinquepunctata]